MKRILTISVLMSVLVSGCSSGPGSETSAPPAEQGDPSTVVNLNPQGAWSGTSPQGRSIWGVVREDGTYWFLYSAINDPASLGGGLQGYGSVHGNVLTSTDVFDYSVDGQGILTGVLTVEFTERRTMTVTMTYTTGSSITFTLLYQPEIFEREPDITQVAGTYPGTLGSNIRSPGILTVTPTAPTGRNFFVDATQGGSGAWVTWQSIDCPTMNGSIIAAPSAFEGMGQVYSFELRSNCHNFTPTNQYGVAIFDRTTNTLMLFAQNRLAPEPFYRKQAFIYRGVKQ